MVNEVEQGTKYVLAMYDVRGKQDFIFRSNKLKEIVGGSNIIRDIFEDYLYPAAESIDVYGKGIFHSPKKTESFSVEGFEKHIAEGYVGELVYDGGGNFLLLLKNKELFKEITYCFTKAVLENIGTLNVLGTCVEIDDFDCFEGDRSRLYKVHRINENRESKAAPWATLPIVQVDYVNSMPLTKDSDKDWSMDHGKLSKEQYAKLKKYYECYPKEKGRMGEKILDKLVTKKGEDSLLAVVYIDGNNMGAKVQECLKECDNKGYDDCVNALRNFSRKIQEDYIDNRVEEIKEINKKAYRLVLGAGDEINFVCNAHDAFNLATNYLIALPEGCSSCAGIAIFHSTSPYSEAYRIAEECCESGKQLMKKCHVNEASFIDFHYCQGAVGTSLERIREDEELTDISRPWLIKISDKEKASFKEFYKKEYEGKMIVDDSIIELFKDYLNCFGRSNVKGLAVAAKENGTKFQFEIARIKAHLQKEIRIKADEIEEEINKGFGLTENLNDKQAQKTDEKEKIEKQKEIIKKQMQKVIYDMVIVYDIWFDEKKTAGGKSDE